jgi:hypothetical protein
MRVTPQQNLALKSELTWKAYCGSVHAFVRALLKADGDLFLGSTKFLDHSLHLDSEGACIHVLAGQSRQGSEGVEKTSKVCLVVLVVLYK